MAPHVCSLRSGVEALARPPRSAGTGPTLAPQGMLAPSYPLSENAAPSPPRVAHETLPERRWGPLRPSPRSAPSTSDRGPDTQRWRQSLRPRAALSWLGMLALDVTAAQQARHDELLRRLSQPQRFASSLDCGPAGGNWPSSAFEHHTREPARRSFAAPHRDHLRRSDGCPPPRREARIATPLEVVLAVAAHSSAGAAVYRQVSSCFLKALLRARRARRTSPTAAR